MPYEQANRDHDVKWVKATLALRHAPPCVYGAGHAFCAVDEPGCTLPPVQPVAPSDCAAAGSAVQRWCDGYSAAAAALRLFTTQRTPLGKVSALRAALRCLAAIAHVEGRVLSKRCEELASSIDSVVVGDEQRIGESTRELPQVGNNIGADDLVPRLCCLLVQAAVPGLVPQIAYLEDTLPDDVANGEEGYTLVTLRGAISHIQDMAGSMRAGD